MVADVQADEANPNPNSKVLGEVVRHSGVPIAPKLGQHQVTKNQLKDSLKTDCNGQKLTPSLLTNLRVMDIPPKHFLPSFQKEQLIFDAPETCQFLLQSIFCT